jgi:hypothetical protein
MWAFIPFSGTFRECCADLLAVFWFALMFDERERFGVRK